MTTHLMNIGASFFASSREILNDRSVEIEIGSDFEQYRDIVAEGRPMQQLGVPFDPARNDLHEMNAFWLIARNADGVLIHTQAAKQVPMSGKLFADHMRHEFINFPPPLPDIDYERSRFRASPGTRVITGNVVYHGEVWLDPDDPSVRGSGLSTVLARYGLMTATSRWDPDFVFGFMLGSVAYKGFAERMGYMHNEPGVLRWYRTGQERPLEAFLSYLSNDEIRYLFDLPMRDLVAGRAA